MQEKKYSKDIARAIDDLLKNDDMRFTFEEDRGIFRFGVGLSGKMRSLSFFIVVKSDEYLVYAISPISADPKDSKMMAAMAEFVCRASYGLLNGNFELDFRDGEIRYKSFVDCDGGAIPTQKIIRNSIHCPVLMFERYAPGILAVLFGGASAKDAIESCESRRASELLKALAGGVLPDEADPSDGSDEDGIVTDLFDEGTDDTSGAETL